MKRFVSGLAVGLCCVAWAGAQELSLKVVKDAAIFGHSSEREFNGGKGTRLKTKNIKSPAAEFAVMDFDRAAIKTFLAKNEGKTVGGKLAINIKQVQNVGDTPVKLEVASLDSAVDWNEGGGVQVKAGKGESCSAAAQFEVTPWKTPDGKEVAQFRDLVWDGEKVKGVLNGTALEIGKGSGGKMLEMELDEAFIKHLATSENCRGVFFFCRDPKAKIDINSREQNKMDAILKITVK